MPEPIGATHEYRTAPPCTITDAVALVILKMDISPINTGLSIIEERMILPLNHVWFRVR
jgi:hypothetical protein